MEVGKMMSSSITSPDNSKEVDDGGKVVLPGFRFHPTDEELVGFYLRRKVEKKTLRIELIIRQVDVYKYDPWDLPRVSTVGDKEGYFFCIRGRKYRNSIRPNRVTGSGFWKATGIDKQIYSSTTTNGSATTDQYCIGLKKSLVYYRGCAGKGTKTDWMMHEFRLPPSCQNDNQPQEAEVWTLCRIFKRNASYSYVKYKAAEWKLKENDRSVNTNRQSPSKTFSMESVTTRDNINDHQLVNFRDTRLMVQQNERKLPVIEGNYDGGHELLAPFVTTTAPYSSCWNLINRDIGDHHHHHHEQLFREGNWDELRSVVDRAGY